MIDAKQVLHVARLARLKLADDDVQPMADELSTILGHIEQMGTLDLDGVKPTTTVVPVEGKLRADEPEAPLAREIALSQAPRHTDTSFVVPSPGA